MSCIKSHELADKDKEEIQYHEFFKIADSYHNTLAFHLIWLIRYTYLIVFDYTNKSAISELEKLIETYIALYDEIEMTVFYDYKGLYSLMWNQFDVASLSLNQALDYAESNKNNPLMGLVYFHMISLNQQLNQNINALLYCEKAINEFNKTYNFKRLLLIEIDKAGCLARLNMFKESEELLLKVLTYPDYLLDNDILYIIYDNLAWYSRNAKEYEKCITYSEKMSEYQTENEDYYSFISYSYYKLSEKEKALEICNKGIADNKCFVLCKLFLELLKARILKLDTLFLSKANEYLELSISLNKEFQERKIVLEIISEYYEEKEDYQNLSSILKQIISNN